MFIISHLFFLFFLFLSAVNSFCSILSVFLLFFYPFTIAKLLLLSSIPFIFVFFYLSGALCYDSVHYAMTRCLMLDLVLLHDGYIGKLIKNVFENPI